MGIMVIELLVFSDGGERGQRECAANDLRYQIIAFGTAHEALKAWPSCAHRARAIRGRLQGNAVKLSVTGRPALLTFGSPWLREI